MNTANVGRRAIGCALVIALAGAGRPAAAQQATGGDSAQATVASGAPDGGRPNPRAAQPERPTVATHAYTVAPGLMEIEAGVQATRPEGASETDAPVVLKFGVTRRIQLELIGGWSRRTADARPATVGAPSAPAIRDQGFGDLAIAPKMRVLFQAPVLANFSVQPSLKLATGSEARGTGTGTTDVGLLLISSRNLGPVALDLNAGVTLRSGHGDRAPRTATLLTASAGTTVSGALGWVLELFAYPGTSGPAGTPPQVGLLSGPTLTVRPWLVLDAGFIANVHGFPANSAYAGVTWNVGRVL